MNVITDGILNHWIPSIYFNFIATVMKYMVVTSNIIWTAAPDPAGMVHLLKLNWSYGT